MKIKVADYVKTSVDYLPLSYNIIKAIHSHTLLLNDYGILINQNGIFYPGNKLTLVKDLFNEHKSEYLTIPQESPSFLENIIVGALIILFSAMTGVLGYAIYKVVRYFL